MKSGMQLKWLKPTIKVKIEIDISDYDVSRTSYSNFVTDKPKIQPFSVLVRILVKLSRKLVQWSIFRL